jgi:hypothetical protein
MGKGRKKRPDEELDPAEHEEELHDEELHDEDFQFALKQLLAVYEPILEEELKRAKDPDRLKEEAQDNPPDCEEEFELADRIFDQFFTEEVALRLLPKEGREQFGPVERWRWCLLHIRCCIAFGWLVCRRPLTFRGLVYYLHRYWLCVRRALGITPEDRPLNDQEREDLATLVQAFARAYKPYLTGQLASVEISGGLLDEVLDGKIDCFEGEEEAAAVFERALTMEVAPALLGKEAFEKYRQEPYFWFCRCWCLCAIRFGCCLGKAKSLLDVLRCLRSFWDCTRECFRPLVCEITQPTANACADEQFYPGPSVLGVEIVGTATGAFCDHYTLEWKPAAAPDSAYTSTGIVYAGAPGPGTCGKVNATLGYLTTTAGPVPDSVTVRLCVVATTGATECCTVEFEIFRQRVWITGLEGVTVESPPGVLGPTAQLKTGADVRSFGTALRVNGRAWVGKCAGREVKRYTLSYQPGFVTNPLVGVWTQFWQVDYDTPLQRKEIADGEFALTSRWRYDPICLPPPNDAICFPKDWLTPARWRSGRNFPDTPVSPQSFPIDPQVPGTVWTSQQLPLVNCQSGRYTLRLDVEDTVGNHYYDTQQVWFDNKKIHGKITQVAGVPACATLKMSDFAAPGADCSVPWLADLLGIAYDEYIEEGNTANPSDNFGGYRLWIKKDGAPNPGEPLTIPGPGGPPWGPPFVGTSRVGDPGERCTTATPPPGPVPAETPMVLASLDLRRLDAVCNPAEPQLTLQRGECCGFLIRLLVWDDSVCPSLSGNRHQIEHDFPICICNDLPPLGQDVAGASVGPSEQPIG